ncbi:MAG: pyridoxamine 5'-phosphate oxidase [Verrucomicrobiota bacterium]|nr:pyridoxamine 5'-phosphate oxidase [Verrucomicrobiota bacterium]
MNPNNISDLRISYTKATLNIEVTDPCPFNQFEQWLNEAIEAKTTEATAMSLATVNEKGHPSVRTVLLKGFSRKGFVFYTNFESRKATEIECNPNVGICFLWKELERQVTIKGSAKKVSKDKSEKYFKSRPTGHQISAWASTQSSKVPNRKWMLEREEELRTKFSDREIPYPDFWGGFQVSPIEIEFWQGRENRFHDRIVYRYEKSKWTRSRLSP